MSDYSPDNMTVANGPKPFTPRADDLAGTLNRTSAASTSAGLQGGGSTAQPVAPTVASPEIPAPMPEVKGDIERALETVREKVGLGHKRGDQGIKAKVNGREVTLDVIIMIEYGHVVMDVARNVKYNVAHQTARMLGLRVVEVNVIVDDVRLPGAPKPVEEPDDGYVAID